MSSESYRIHDWIALSRPYQATVQTILNMKPGETKSFICLDRNWKDLTIWSNNLPLNTPMRPEVFFKKGYHLSFTKMIPQNEWTDSLAGIVEIDGDNVGNTITGDKNRWEFDLNYDGEKNWFPLDQNQLLANVCENPAAQTECWKFCEGCVGCCQTGPKKFAHINLFQAINEGLFGWSLQTRLGWRGPLIPMDYLPFLPNIYYTKED